MPTYPSNVATVTVTGYWAASDGSGAAASGIVTFTPNSVLQDGTSTPAEILLPKPVSAVLVNGAISVTLMATDDTHLSPSGWVYTVVENISGYAQRTYNIQLTSGTSPVDLTAVGKVATPPAQTAYVQASAVGAVGGVAGPLDANKQLPAAQIPAAYVHSIQPSGDTTGATDTANIMAAENAGTSIIMLAPGTFWTTGLTKKAGTIWQGAGRLKTTIKLAAGANTDVVQGDQFAALTLTGNTSGGIGGWGIRDLSIDGNKTNQTGTSYGIRVYGYNFDLSRVSILNCLTDGLYTEWANFGGSNIPDSTMEARYDGLKIHDCGGNGWHNRGPHDSRAIDVTIFNNSASGYGYWGEANNATTVAAGSNGVDLSTFTGSGVLNVATTLGYATAASLTVATAKGNVTVTYTGKTATSFTGCTATASSGSTVSTGGAVSPTGAYSAAGMMLTNCHVWGSPLWDYVLDTQTHLIDCVGEVAAPGGGMVLLRSNSQVIGGMYVIYTGFAQNGLGLQIGDAANACTGARVDTNLSGLSGADAAHAAINIVGDGGSNSVDALVYQPTGTAVFGTPNTGYSRYRIGTYGAASRGGNAAGGLHLVNGKHVMDVPSANAAWTVGSSGTDYANLNTANSRWEFVNGLLIRLYSGAYSGTTLELDAAKGHINFPGTTAPSGSIVTTAIGTAGNGASVSVTGNDHRGTITVTTASTGLGSFPATVANLTFAQAWANNPRVVVTPINGASAGVQPYAQAFSTTQFLLGFNVAPAPSTTYTFAYQVMG